VHDQGLTVYLRDINGNIISTLEKNANFKNNLKKYISSELTFSKFENVSKDKLNYYLIKPKNFDVNKKYPLLMYLYGGPGNSQVQNQWLGRNRLWFEYLSQKGYLIACLDNRGTGLKGREFKHATTMQLGKLESEDQIAFAKYMASLPYIDKDRIGLFGWSYGGYLSSLCLLLGNDVFKAAIAVAPVTNWRFYDTIYTERYLKNPKDNAVGYDQYSPITHADKLKGNLLLIHGTADDNVHFQNTVEFQNALIESNKQFESFFYPNKDHAINGRKTRLHLYTLMTNFILKKL
jgi:dipeptidyl-peptidase-4